MDAEVRAGEFAIVDQLDRAVMRLHAFHDDRQANAGAGHLSALLTLPLKECLKDPWPLILRNSRTCVRELQHKTVGPGPAHNRDCAAFWRELDGIGQQIVENRAHLVVIGGNRELRHVDLQLNAGGFQRQSLCLDDVQNQRAQLEICQRHCLALGLPGAETQQVFDQLLQLQPVGAQNPGNLALFVVQLTDGAVYEQFRAFPNIHQRRFQLVRHVAEKPVLFLGELEQPGAQPFELSAKALEITRSLDLDGAREATLTELFDRFVDLADRSGNEERENQNQKNRARHQGDRLPGGNRLCAFRAFLQRP